MKFFPMCMWDRINRNPVNKGRCTSVIVTIQSIRVNGTCIASSIFELIIFFFSLHGKYGVKLLFFPFVTFRLFLMALSSSKEKRDVLHQVKSQDNKQNMLFQICSQDSDRSLIYEKIVLC